MDDGTAQRLKSLRSLGSSLLAHDDQTVSAEQAKDFVLEFLKQAEYTPLGGIPNPLNTWYRARVQTPGEFVRDHLSQVLYRKEPSTEFGRAHFPGDRVMYAAWNASTAFAEVGAKDGETIWLAHIRPRQDRKVIASLVGAYAQVYRTGRLHYPISAVEAQVKSFLLSKNLYSVLATVYADSVLASILRTPGKTKYHLSAAIARLLHQNHDTSVFLYPSVQLDSCINVAMDANTFDNCFEVMAVERLVVGTAMGLGVNLMDSHMTCHDFSPDGHINWYSLRRHNAGFSLESGLQYAATAVGWRVPESWRL